MPNHDWALSLDLHIVHVPLTSMLSRSRRDWRKHDRCRASRSRPALPPLNKIPTRFEQLANDPQFLIYPFSLFLPLYLSSLLLATWRQQQVIVLRGSGNSQWAHPPFLRWSDL